ncbi:MAG: acetolactate synthase small subunit [Candidatus Altiarchaeota archaeon]|nr:acetolactate synthase small subunit [Candidatus Altiarchaeota archaeon]
MSEKVHLLSALVENRPGVMQRISGMFARRGFNIENITVGPTENPAYSRITLSVKGDAKTLEQVVKQMNKLISVIKVRDIKDEEAVCRELALIKISTPNGNVRSEVAQFVDVFRGNIVDVGTDSIIAEIVGDSEKIDAFVKVISQYGIKEVARTGTTALSRGGKMIRDSVK